MKCPMPFASQSVLLLVIILTGCATVPTPPTASEIRAEEEQLRQEQDDGAWADTQEKHTTYSASPTTIRLIVEQFNREAGDASFPYYEEHVRTLFGLLGIEVVDADARDYDATLGIL